MFSNIILWLCLGVVMSAPLPRKLVDLTHVFDEGAHKYPLFKEFNLSVVLNGTLDSGIWLQSEDYVSTTHAGTHMDAPSHFIKGGIDIDQLPLDLFVGPAAVIDITHKASSDSGAEVTVEDLQNWESETGQRLDHHIVLMKSGWSKKYRDRMAYLGKTSDDLTSVTDLHFPGFSGTAAEWLVEHRKIKGIGVDTLSLDKGTSSDFPVHLAILGNELFGLENVANLEDIPIIGAELYVLPMKIAGASGAPTRILANYPEVIFSISS